MKIFPAIDVRGGKVVRLTQGDYAKMTVYGDSPLSEAARFADCGAEYLHLVDLDGALDGKLVNAGVVRAIKEKYPSLFVEIGGGVRNGAAVCEYLENCGADRVILGSAAVEDFGFVESSVAKYGARIAVGVDAKDGKVAIHGWKTVTDISAFDFIDRLAGAGVDTAIYTDISRDGMLTSPNFDAYSQIVSKIKVVASGGVSSLADIERLAKIGADGVIVGRAIYTGAVDLKAAVALGKAVL